MIRKDYMKLQPPSSFLRALPPLEVIEKKWKAFLFSWYLKQGSNYLIANWQNIVQHIWNINTFA